jgi:DNA-binding IclR family transcriptional regulator
LERSGVQVLDRALNIIEQLATSEIGLSISELASRTNLSKSTVHRILRTYCSRHYVQQDAETSVYSLGYKFVEIASIYLNAINLKIEAAPFMHELATFFNATVYLGVFENNEVMYLERVEKYNSLRLYSQIGKREPLHCTGLGKVLLSGLSKERFEAVAKSLQYHRFTPHTKTTFEELEMDVILIKKLGYAVDRYEHTLEHSCFAMPIRDYTGQIIAAMSVSGPALLENFSIANLQEKMCIAVDSLSRRIGYSGIIPQPNESAGQ